MELIEVIAIIILSIPYFGVGLYQGGKNHHINNRNYFIIGSIISSMFIISSGLMAMNLNFGVIFLWLILFYWYGILVRLRLNGTNASLYYSLIAYIPIFWFVLSFFKSKEEEDRVRILNAFD